VNLSLNSKLIVLVVGRSSCSDRNIPIRNLGNTLITTISSMEIYVGGPVVGKIAGVGIIIRACSEQRVETILAK
jgi:hypothetical protein